MEPYADRLKALRAQTNIPMWRKQVHREIGIQEAQIG